jgi:hypothetical protein
MSSPRAEETTTRRLARPRKPASFPTRSRPSPTCGSCPPTRTLTESHSFTQAEATTILAKLREAADQCQTQKNSTSYLKAAWHLAARFSRFNSPQYGPSFVSLDWEHLETVLQQVAEPADYKSSLGAVMKFDEAAKAIRGFPSPRHVAGKVSTVHPDNVFSQPALPHNLPRYIAAGDEATDLLADLFVEATTMGHVGSTPYVNSSAESKFALCVNTTRHPARFKIEPLTVFQTRHPPALKLQWLACSATRQNLSLGGWQVSNTVSG